MMKTQRSILLVEDDIIDAMTTKRALKEIHVLNDVITLKNGEEALEYLENGKLETPCLVLLDLNMPRMNGIEFLKEARKKNLLPRTPVIVLTTSKEEKDKIETFKLYVAGYMVKPVDYIQFVEVVRTIDVYWTLSEVP
jgi:CheY-like chemotaxis protein